MGEAKQLKLDLLRKAEERARVEREKLELEERNVAAVQMQSLFRQSNARKVVKKRKQARIPLFSNSYPPFLGTRTLLF